MQDLQQEKPIEFLPEELEFNLKVKMDSKDINSDVNGEDDDFNESNTKIKKNVKFKSNLNADKNTFKYINGDFTLINPDAEEKLDADSIKFLNYNKSYEFMRDENEINETNLHTSKINSVQVKSSMKEKNFKIYLKGNETSSFKVENYLNHEAMYNQESTIEKEINETNFQTPKINNFKVKSGMKEKNFKIDLKGNETSSFEIDNYLNDEAIFNQESTIEKEFNQTKHNFQTPKINSVQVKSDMKAKNFKIDLKGNENTSFKVENYLNHEAMYNQESKIEEEINETKTNFKKSPNNITNAYTSESEIMVPRIKIYNDENDEYFKKSNPKEMNTKYKKSFKEEVLPRDFSLDSNNYS